MEESYPKTPPYLAGGTGRQRGGVLERGKDGKGGGVYDNTCSYTVKLKVMVPWFTLYTVYFTRNTWTNFHLQFLPSFIL